VAFTACPFCLFSREETSMQASWSIRVLICGAALCLAHCDFGQESVDEKGESGVTRSRLLKDVSPDEAEKLCAFSAAEFARAWSSEETFCTLFGNGDFELTCEEQLDACVASDDFETLASQDPHCKGYDRTRFVWGDDCDATVGDWESCTRTAYRAMDEHYAGATCRSIALRDEDFMPTPECRALTQKCKNLGGENANSE